MRLLNILIAALLPAAALSARRGAASTNNIYETHYSKSSPNLKLDDSLFDALTAQPRNHSTVVSLTALDARFGCNLCHQWKPEWELLTKSWISGDKDAKTRVLFGQLDFLDGKQTFESLKLTTAPILLFFPPTTGPYAKPNAQPSRYDFSTGGPPSADLVHTWLGRQFPSEVAKPRLNRPINWVRLVTITTLVLGSITGAFVAWPYVMPVAQSRNLWAGICIILILLFTSGYMFNHIRGMPYVGGNSKGGISYFAPGFQNQYGLESQIVAVIYGVLAFATIVLALQVPRMRNPKTQQVAVIVWGAVVYGTYSFLLSTFRLKNGGYPLWLPPF